jgi:hypothetical protein
MSVLKEEDCIIECADIDPHPSGTVFWSHSESQGKIVGTMKAKILPGEAP